MKSEFKAPFFKVQMLILASALLLVSTPVFSYVGINVELGFWNGANFYYWVVLLAVLVLLFDIKKPRLRTTGLIGATLSFIGFLISFLVIKGYGELRAPLVLLGSLTTVLVIAMDRFERKSLPKREFFMLSFIVLAICISELAMAYLFPRLVIAMKDLSHLIALVTSIFILSDVFRNMGALETLDEEMLEKT